MTEIHTLQVTDGSGTVDLSDGTNTRFIEYTPQVSSNGEPVRESLSIHFLAGTLATNTGNVQSLNKLFEQARNYQRSETGNRVYVQLDTFKAGTVYRSRLFDGKANLRSETLAYHSIRQKFILDIEWIRQPFWEGTLTQIPLTNSAGTLDTSGLTVYNTYDASGDNWVGIEGTSVIGDMPAPIKVELQNAYSSAQPADEFWFNHNVYSTPGSLDNILEAENATGGTLTATAEGTPGASEGSYAAIQWDGTVETAIVTFSLSSAALGNMAGGLFGIVARWNVAFPYDDCWTRLNLETGGNTLYQGEISLIPDTRELHLLETMRLPPYLPGQGSLQAIDLVLYAQRLTAGTHTLNLDFLQLSPISGMAGWKHFTSIGAGVEYQAYFYHDATEGFDYTVGTAGNKIADFQNSGGPIELIPGQDQRLYFLSSDSNGSALVEQSWTAKLWYRPRKNIL